MSAAISLPSLVSARHYITLRRLWIASHVIFGLSMLATFVFTSTIGTVFLFSVVGFSWAASIWIPYVLLGAEISCHPSQQENPASISPMERCRDQDKDHDSCSEYSIDFDVSGQPGLIYGMHNVSICLPQMLVTFGMGLQSVLSADNSNDFGGKGLSLIWILRLGGCSALVAAYFATGIDDSC